MGARSEPTTHRYRPSGLRLEQSPQWRLRRCGDRPIVAWSTHSNSRSNSCRLVIPYGSAKPLPCPQIARLSIFPPLARNSRNPFRLPTTAAPGQSMLIRMTVFRGNRLAGPFGFLAGICKQIFERITIRRGECFHLFANSCLLALLPTEISLGMSDKSLFSSATESAERSIDLSPVLVEMHKGYMEGRNSANYAFHLFSIEK